MADGIKVPNESTIDQNLAGYMKFYPNALSHEFPNWSAYVSGLVVGFMQNIGGFIGYIEGNTYHPINGADISTVVTFSYSGNTLVMSVINNNYQSQLTMISVLSQ